MPVGVSVGVTVGFSVGASVGVPVGGAPVVGLSERDYFLRLVDYEQA